MLVTVSAQDGSEGSDWNLQLVQKSATKIKSTTRKPMNILFLMSDSMDGRVLDPTSPISSYLEMPYMWSLASQGVNFVSTYANNPQCAPSRASMFTGRHTHRIKAWNNMKSIVATPGSGISTGKWELDRACKESFDETVCAKWAEEQNVSDTLLDTLIDGGVDVAIYGKVDIGANVLNRADQQNHHPTCSGFHAGDVNFVGRAADIRKPTKSRPQTVEHVWHYPTRDMHYDDWKTIAECKKWLEGNSNSDSSKPWMLYCSLEIPHPPYECNSQTELSVSSNIPLPEWFTNATEYPESSMHPYDSYMSTSKGMMDEQGAFEAEYLEKSMRCWYAMCNQTDAMVGSVWEKAAETGNLDNTMVIFLADHGEMHMEHRQWLKNSMYEGSARVPLIIAGPGSNPGSATRAQFNSRGKIVRDITSLVDIYPTLADATGVSVPLDLDGESLMPYITGSGSRSKNFAVSMYMSNYANTQAFMIRKDEWKYIAYGTYGPSWYKNYTPQLFNVMDDPGELTNVILSHTNVASDLDALLLSVVDYGKVDREVKMEEKMLYDRFYKQSKNFSQHDLLALWAQRYQGFSADDLVKVFEWYESVE